MTPRSFVNGRAGDAIDARDRGLLYGDGLFETVLFVDGAAPLWLRHRARLESDAARLALPLPDVDAVFATAREACRGIARAAVRITLTRGVGERGYAPPAAPEPVWVVTATPAPTVPPDWYVHGIRVRCCGLRLATQPRLAGIKHLNRLEHVLARAEWNDPAVAEGLLGDAHGNAIGATAANLFVVRDGRLLTPALDECGVAGVTRADLLEGRDVGVVRLTWDEVMRADEVFLTSSLRGILPVNRIDDRAFAPGPVARALQAHWRERGLMEPAHG
ncbi:MAG TPA: aminodeoxychorismate lyase [Tahibacter sp.]|uniref:aminodeoxychorismate lyase n=1 Tax=Tahibacter sp. TaxID=2056211 RepID=UPI002B58C3E3|nr:aminodeoxychorismate lyase [Tahibacter sp.]HSX61446.1 aminodeoxychorismate lyase [Tahibacter sp.]